MKFASFLDFWVSQSNDGSRYQKSALNMFIELKRQLNFNWFTVKLHNSHHANVHTYSTVIWQCKYILLAYLFWWDRSVINFKMARKVFFLKFWIVKKYWGFYSFPYKLHKCAKNHWYGSKLGPSTPVLFWNMISSPLWNLFFCFCRQVFTLTACR